MNLRTVLFLGLGVLAMGGCSADADLDLADGETSDQALSGAKATYLTTANVQHAMKDPTFNTNQFIYTKLGTGTITLAVKSTTPKSFVADLRVDFPAAAKVAPFIQQDVTFTNVEGWDAPNERSAVGLPDEWRGIRISATAWMAPDNTTVTQLGFTRRDVTDRDLQSSLFLAGPAVAKK